ncbi:hypothetical protein CAPI_07405 [Corynebacterium capitovis DSM 44611]|uniref:DUF3806 domain-containing protein n=1 Tax=Corynebacterium capitovis TaxID=131081 RepID=UPI00035E7E0E|nr:DUF3806 domain-containing protein [Corynebacterium capitovis]WKD58019.1 hypothetical protein CAPI_07405 [Corynebacterium capitovis DSM 44611]
MAFSDIDPQTRTQIDRDLAEAAGRGIGGTPRDVAETFESTLADYLSLDPDLQRTFPRGETARMYGTALGEAFVREHGYSWAYLDDDYGTDLVVNRGDSYTAPLVVVSARFDDDAPGKLTTFVDRFLDAHPA